jgi:hypothetical protein
VRLKQSFDCVQCILFCKFTLLLDLFFKHFCAAIISSSCCCGSCDAFVMYCSI